MVAALLVSLGYALWLPFHDTITQALITWRSRAWAPAPSSPPSGRRLLVMPRRAAEEGLEVMESLPG